MPDPIRPWLETLDLGRFAALFVENGIDLSVLPHITDDELKEIGLPLGARRKIRLRLESGAPAEVAVAIAADAERRRVTVMFCDLVGATALSARLDPEDYREVIRAYQDACAGEITRLDGFVAQFLGDGVMAYFGWPRAHEDDVSRAIHAGLDIVDAVGGVQAVGGEALRVRVGIATGPVVIGDVVGTGSAQQAAAAGETPNRAARVQGAAGTNAVAVDAATHDVASGLFELESLGAQPLKGIAGDTEVWRVVCKRRVESRFEAERGTRLTTLVGRDEEVALLGRRWRQAVDGEGAVVLVHGEPGIGKSRLAQAIEELIGEESHTRMLLQCSPHHENSALFPVARRIELAAGISAGDDDDTRLAKLEALLGESGPPPDELVPLAAKLLSIPFAPRYELPERPPAKEKERTLSVLVEHVTTLSRRTPVLLVVEDVHWIDPTTLELMKLLVESIRPCRVLAVVTYRPEFDAPWIGEDHVTLLALNRLTQKNRLRLALELADAEGLPADALEQIVERSDGVPLFIEELVRSVRDRCDEEQPAQFVIPPTLSDALQARLDHSPAVREVSQVGAAIGREFGYALLAEVASLEKAVLDAALEDLVGSGLLFVRGTPPDARYTFKHALIQDTAHDSLLRSKRAAVHRRLAESLQEGNGAQDDAAPELIAHHFTEAGDVERAIPLWHEAGRRALARSACVEAASHLDRALGLVPRLPSERRRMQTELELLMTKSPALIFAKGMGSDAVGALQERALDLAEATGHREHAFAALFGAWTHAIQIPPILRGRELAGRLDAMARATGDVGHRLQACHAQWTTALMGGEVREAHRHCDRGIALYDARAHADHKHVYGGHDPGLCAMGFGSLSLWMLGFPDQALAMNERSLDLAREIRHDVSEATALSWVAFCNSFVGRPDRAKDMVRQAIAIAEEYGLVFFESYRLLGHLIDAHLDPDRPVSQPAVAASRRPSKGGLDWFIKPFALTHFSLVQARVGKPDEALALLEDASAFLKPWLQHPWLSELHRLRGLLEASILRDPAAALSSMELARSVARGKGLRSLELRAATSLARLHRDERRLDEARAVLAPVYEWFTEGFDTADLQEASSLLDELGGT